MPIEVVNSVTGLGSEASQGRLTLAIYPHHSSRYELRERGGDPLVVGSEKQGAYDAAATIRISLSAATKDYLLRINANFIPSTVTLDGSELARCDDDFDGSCAWVAQERRVLVKLSTANATATVVLTP